MHCRALNYVAAEHVVCYSIIQKLSTLDGMCNDEGVLLLRMVAQWHAATALL